MTQYVKNHFPCINLSIVIFICLLSSILANATPAFPGYIDFRQPDGSIVKIKMMGDEYLRWAETEDGYSLLFDKSGYLVYADHDSNGDLVATSLRASEVSRRSNEIKSRLTKIGKKIMYSEKQIAKALEVRIADAPAPRRANALGRVINPVVGVRKNLVILVDFPDLPFTYTQQDFDVLMNSEHSLETISLNGSVRDYFREASFGQLDIQSTVVGVYRMSKPMTYYGSNSGNTDTHAREMIIEAINLADADVNFSDFDNDGDGCIDGIHVIYAGYGEEAGAGSDCIWSHSSSINMTLDGVNTGRYSCSPELRGNKFKIKTYIGVICHELGHVLGTKDFYDTNYGANGYYLGTGDWDIMASGSWNYDGIFPAFFNPYTVIYDFGWANPKNGNIPSSYSLKAHDKNSYVKIDTQTEGEFFLVEYRKSESFDKGIPGDGLMVYRASDNLSRKTTNTINARHPQQFYPLSASSPVGLPNYNPSSYGGVNSNSCQFPGELGITEITDFTTPSMMTWTGLETGCPITNIEEDKKLNTINFDIAGGAVEGGFDMKINDSGIDYISLSWKKQNDNTPIMLVYSKTPSFGNPESKNYAINEVIPGGGEVIYVGTDDNYNHDGLQEQEIYYYTLFSWNETQRKWAGSRIISGKTLIGVIRNFPYTEDFQSGEMNMSYIMESLVGDNVWKIRKENADYYMSFYPWDGGDDDQMSTRLILPLMDFTGISSAVLSFEYTNSIESTDVMYRTSPNDDWHHLLQLEHNSHDICHIPLPKISSEYQICIVPNYNRHGTNDKDMASSFKIDDIEISIDTPVFVYTKEKIRVGSRSAEIPISVANGVNNVLSSGIYIFDQDGYWNEVESSADGICYVYDLIPNHEYTYKAFAKFKNGIQRGEEYTLLTLPIMDGEGTKESPYKIKSREDWISAKTMMNDQFNWENKRNSKAFHKLNGVYFLLGSDIELSPDDAWERSLSCYFDGGGHSITIVPSTNNITADYPLITYLIPILEKGSIVENLNIRTSPSMKYYYVKDALLCQENNGLIYNCEITLNNTAYIKNNSDIFGSFATNNNGEISHCSFLCDSLFSNHGIGLAYKNYIAGISSNSFGIIDYCTSRGYMSGYDISGIVGQSSGIVRNCINYVTLDVPSAPEKYAVATKGGGAIVNHNYGLVDCCVNYGTLYGCWIGGIVYNGSNIINCYNMGEYRKAKETKVQWSGKDNYAIAGICRIGSDLHNCFFAGTLTGDFDPIEDFVFCEYKNKKLDVPFNNCYYYGNFDDSRGESLSIYDLASPYFVDTLNAYAQRDVWCLHDGRVKLRMEVEDNVYSTQPLLKLSTPYVRSRQIEINASLIGKDIIECGIEWKDINANNWNKITCNVSNAFVYKLTDLRPLHIYALRIYAITNKGMTYVSETKKVATLYEDVTNTSDTLLLGSINDLKAFAMTVNNNTYINKVVMLKNDIDMLGNKGYLWTPIQGRFAGILDGNGYTLRNMKLQDGISAHTALFSNTGYCKILNLGIYADDISDKTVDAGFVGAGNAIIDKCFYIGKNFVTSPFGRVRKCTNSYAVLDSAELYPNNYYGIVDRLLSDNADIYGKSELTNCYSITNSYFYDIISTIDTQQSIFANCYVQSRYPMVNTNSNATELNETEMKNGTLLDGFNSDEWESDDLSNPINNGYPVLKWQLRNTRVVTQDVIWDKYGLANLRGVYVPGIDIQCSNFGFQWFEKRDNNDTLHVVITEKSDSFEYIIDGLIPGHTYYYRAFATTENKDTICGDWIEFARIDTTPIPYIDNFVQNQFDRTASFNLHCSPGENEIIHYEVRYYESGDISNAIVVNIDNLLKPLTICDLKPHTSYTLLFCVQDAQGIWTESEPVNWITPLYTSNYKLGDSNDDGKIDLLDIVTSIAEIRGVPHKGINYINADIDNNIKINKADILGIKDLLVNNSIGGYPSSSKEMELVIANDTLDIADKSKAYITLRGCSNITAMSFNVVLPSITKIVKAELYEKNCKKSHSIFYQQHEDTTTIIVYSWENESLNNTDVLLGRESVHVILYLDDKYLPSYSDLCISLKNIYVVDKDYNEYGINDMSKNLPIADPLLINGIYYSFDGFSSSTSNFYGMSVRPLKMGKYQGDIIIPDSVSYLGINYPVTSIGSYYQYPRPFENNNDITFLSIPGTIDNIFSNSFRGCSNLKKIILGNGIRKIESGVFDKTSLTSLYIPASVESINGNLGVMNNLQRFEVSPNNLNYSSIDGLLYSKSGKTLVQCLPIKQPSYIVPEFVDTIGISAFNASFECNVIFLKDNIKATGQLEFGKSKYVVLESDELPELLTLNAWPNNNQVLYVKEELIDVCKSLDRWMNYSKILPLKQNTLEFKKGWNWTSFNIISQETCDINSFAKVAEGVQTIESQTQALYNDPVLGWVGNLEFQPEQCYKVSAQKDIEIPTLGGYCDYESKMLYIYPGWNWMPYWPSTPMYVSNAIDRYYGLGDGVVILGQDEFTVYNNNGWQGDFIMQPGKGYMIYSPSEDTDFMYYNYIAPEDIPNNAPTPPSAPESYWTYDAHAFANTMPVIAKVKDAPNPNYEVAAVVNEECRGVSREADGRSLIAVHGEKGETVRFHMHDRMNGVIYEVNEEIQFTNDLTGSFQEPLILTLGRVIGYSVEGTAVEKVVESKYSDVYSIEGVKLIDKATPEQIRNLPKGIYVINGRKVMK